MTLDEAIKHCEDVAEDKCGCAEDCVNEHRQLAEWLKELKAYREADTPQTDCDDRYAVRTDSGEVVAYACPLGCEQTDCAWK